jgi:pulcherriminic acid synthase
MATTNTIDIMSEDFVRDPYAHYKLLRDSAPVYYDARLDVYLISKYADVRASLRDRRFTTAPLATRAEPVMQGVVLAQMEGADHAAKHGIVVRGIASPRAIARHAEIVDRVARALLAPHLSTGSIDLVKDFGSDFAVHVTLEVLGLPTDNHAQVAKWHAGVAEFITSITLDEDRYEYGIACSQHLAEVITPVIEERKRAPQDDLISALCVPDARGITMSTTEIRALCLNVLAAATEPTDKTLGMLFWRLLSDDNLYQDVLADRSLLPAAIAETLRISPPVQIIPRQLNSSVTVAGTNLPAGAVTFMMIGSANRDSDAFAEPDRFDIHRAELSPQRSFTGAAQHMAFGTGIHACVGAAFARDELNAAANIILDHLPSMKLAHDFEYEEVGLYTRGPRNVRVTFGGAST